VLAMAIRHREISHSGGSHRTSATGVADCDQALIAELTKVRFGKMPKPARW
jgi:hypothetical protein